MVNLIVFLAVSIGFAFFDSRLWPKVANTDWEMFYRSSQVVVQIILYAFAVSISGWVTGLACAIFWWTAGCDVLYYWFLGKNVKEDERCGYPWLWWCPIGLFSPKPLKIKAIQIYAQASIGLLVSIFLVLL